MQTLRFLWKRSVLNSERILTDVDRNDLSPANVTAKSARELIVLKVFKAPNVEIKLVEKHLFIKAICELPFKVTLENKLRCFQYKVIHNILPTNSRLHKMKLKTSPSCDLVALHMKLYLICSMNVRQYKYSGKKLLHGGTKKDQKVYLKLY